MLSLFEVGVYFIDFHLVYGFRTPSTDTVHLHRVLDIAHDLSRVIMPGKLPPVDIFPFLNYLPERLFDNWRSKCRNVAKKSDKLYAEFLDHVIERREKLGSKDTFADKVLEQKGDDAFTRHEVMYLLSTVLDAGTDTTSGAFNTLVQMLTQNQHILKDAQEEMDQVVGENRTPCWEDFGKLRMINYLMKEVQRFRPIVPIAFPHALSEGSALCNSKLNT